VETHRRLAYVPGEANLWPSLTGAETLHLLGRVRRPGSPRSADATS
jgi:polyether ionophore transport system ATP-binding protein